MKGPLREVYEIVVDRDRLSYRAAYYVTKESHGPVVVLDVFVKKSKTGVATPKPMLERISTRLKWTKESERA
jgi:phage-related protein